MQLVAVLVENGEAGARHRHRHAAQQRIVDHCRLRQVRRLRRTADVRHRGQHGILHHRPQQRVGRKRRGALHQFFGSEAAAVQPVLLAVAAQRQALAVFQQEDERGLLLHVDLRVISGGGQFRDCVPAPARSAPEPLHRAAQRGRRQLAERRQHRVHLQNVEAATAGGAAVRRTPCPWCCRRGRSPPPGRPLPRRRADRASQRAIPARAAQPV